MAKLKEIKFEEMTTKQKLGFVNAVSYPKVCSAENEEYILTQIKNRALGAIWIQFSSGDIEIVREHIRKVRETADYPIIIMTDAESGMGEYKIGHHNPISCTGNDDYAYAFGKAVGVTARELGYNTVCNPLLDISTTGSSRSFGSDKYVVAKFAAAEARGMHDAGILTVGKHYPSPKRDLDVDTHMAEGISTQTKEELTQQSLYAYLELMREGLLDGIMAGHSKLVNIDPSAPASLSKPVINVIREQGYDGFIISDALCMMGVRAKFGKVDPMGLCIEAGCDLPLMYTSELIFNQNSLYDCYERKIISDEALDNAVKHILAAQHKVFVYENQKNEDITECEDRLVKSIDYDATFEKVDDGISKSISRDGKYYFVLMLDNGSSFGRGGIDVDTFSEKWHMPDKISEKITELFPNSKIQLCYQFPNQRQCHDILNDSFGYDDVIFVTYSEFLCYTGAEHFTHRFIALAEAMQYTNRVSTLVHFGNPMIIGELPHFSRIIVGGGSFNGTMAGLEALAGEREANGVLTYEVDFK